jgi:hypothetical protein
MRDLLNLLAASKLWGAPAAGRTAQAPKRRRPLRPAPARTDARALAGLLCGARSGGVVDES